MWGDIEDLLMLINSTTWIAYLLGFFLTLILLKSWSYRVSLAIWLLSDLVKIVITPYMYSLSDISKEFARVVWYPSFMLVGLISLYMLMFFHKKNRVKPDKESELIFVFTAGLFFLNAIRFLDRVVFHTNLLAEVYKYGVLSIKVFAVFAIFKHLWSIRLREQGVAWNWKF